MTKERHPGVSPEHGGEARRWKSRVFTRTTSRLLLLLVLMFLMGQPWGAWESHREGAREDALQADGSTPQPAGAEVLEGLPGYFVENRGQIGPGGGRLYVLGDPLSASFDRGWFAYDLRGPGGGTLVRVSFDGANDVEPRGAGPTGHGTSFITGNDPSRWVRGAKGFEEVRYDDLWDGIALSFRLEGGLLKYDILVSPGADPSRARFVYEGASSLSIADASGDLLIGTPDGIIRDLAPRAAQLGDGGSNGVPVRFCIAGRSTVGLRVGGYDPSQPLLIDPGVSLSTLVGGAEYDHAYDMCVGGSGDVLLAGSATVDRFPTTPGAYDTGENGSAKGRSAVVLRLSANLSRLINSTYLGGSSSDEGKALQVMGDGSLWVFGETYSDDFPTTEGAYDRSRNGSMDLFIARLSADGSDLLFGTYFGGGSTDQLGGAIVDGAGCIFLTGGTFSDDLPTTRGAYDTYFGRTYNKEAFVAKLNANGSALEYCTYIGEEGSEKALSVMVDSQGRATVAGTTTDRAFPVTSGAYNGSLRGGYDVFVLRLDANGSGLVFSSAFGTDQNEEVNAMAVDDKGRIHIAGATGDGQRFPRVWGSYNRLSRGSDAFVVRMAANASRFEYSCVIGGRSADVATALEVADDGRVVFTGYTQSSDFPTSENADGRTLKGGRDVFICELHAEGRTLMHSTLVGGTDYDTSSGLLLGDGEVVVCGSTASSGFPTTAGAYSTTLAGQRDMFVLRYGLPEPDTTPPSILRVDAPEATRTRRPYKVFAEVADDRGVHNATVRTWCDNNATRRWSTMRYVEGDRTGSTFWSWVGTHSDWPGTFYIVIEAVDTSGNVNVSDPVAVPMSDGLPPRIDMPWPLPPATTGDPYNVTVNVTDNFGVAAVYCLYSKYYPYGDDDDHVNQTMVAVNSTATGNGTYSTQIPGDWLSWVGQLWLRFVALDTDGNVVRYSGIDAQVVDDDPPVLEDLSPAMATTGDAYIFRARVLENIRLVHVTVSFAFGESGPIPRRWEMFWDGDAGSFASRPVFIPASFLGWINYTLEASDWTGNMGTTAERWVPVVDDDPPELSRDPSDGPCETGGSFSVRVAAVDNIGVDRVSLLYSFDEAREGTVEVLQLSAERVSGLGNGSYAGEIQVLERAPGRLSYAFEALDLAGNRAVTSWTRVAIADTIPPRIIGDASDGIAFEGVPFQFRATVVDNLGLGWVKVAYWFGDGTRTVEHLHRNGTEWTRTVQVPKGTPGPMRYELSAQDLSGLATVFEAVRVEVANPAPQLVGPIEWTVWEDCPSELDLGPFLRDANDPLPTLHLSCNHPNVAAVGHVLVASYPNWVPDHPLEVLVSDGVSTTRGSVLVHVNPLNHPPTVRIVSPQWGTEFQEGEPVTLEAELDDPDMVEGQVLEVVWSSNLTGELLRHPVPGEPPVTNFTLPPGTHMIRAFVSDGERGAADQVIITVLPSAPPPGGQGDGDVSGPTGGSSGMMAPVAVIALALAIAVVVGLVRGVLHRTGRR